MTLWARKTRNGLWYWICLWTLRQFVTGGLTLTTSNSKCSPMFFLQLVSWKSNNGGIWIVIRASACRKCHASEDEGSRSGHWAWTRDSMSANSHTQERRDLVVWTYTSLVSMYLQGVVNVSETGSSLVLCLCIMEEWKDRGLLRAILAQRPSCHIKHSGLSNRLYNVCVSWQKHLSLTKASTFLH